MSERLSALSALTSLRFFAALMVYFRHLFFFKGHVVLGSLYVTYLAEGYIGVTFFFLLSGFILTYNYYERFQEVNWFSVRKFYRARLARIYPLHFLTLMMATVFLIPLFVSAPWEVTYSGVINLLLLHWVHVSEYTGVFNGPSWSLSCEVIFYALFPFLSWFFWRMFSKKSVSRLVAVVVATFVVYAVLVWWWRDVPNNWSLLYSSPLFRIADFIIGMLLAVIFLKHRVVRKVPKRDIGWFTLLEMICVTSFAIQVWLSPAVHQSLRFSVYYLPVMAIIIYVFAQQGGLLSRWLTARELVFLGEISFSFYMIQGLVVRLFIYLSIIESQPLVVALLAFVITMVLSIVTYHYYENPLRYWFKSNGIKDIFIAKKSSDLTPPLAE